MKKRRRLLKFVSETPGFLKQIFCVHSFQRSLKCCNTTIPLKEAWSHTNHGNSTPTRGGFENTFSSRKRSSMDNFVSNKLD